MGLVANENVSEALQVAAVLAAASLSGASANIGPFSLATGMRALFVVQCATIAGGTTIDFQVKASATSGGTYANVAGATITQITAGTTPIFMVEVKAETLNGASQGPWLKGVITAAVAANVCGGIAYIAPTHYDPASDGNIAAVVQTVVV